LVYACLIFIHVLAELAFFRTLARVDPQRSRVVELRFFGGLTIEETAQVMGVSTPTIERGWRAARAWLQTELSHMISKHESGTVAKDL
jgi:DNA-directed RNA polymerase specialized sigma24 family protein